jgi:hypothetical protein
MQTFVEDFLKPFLHEFRLVPFICPLNGTPMTV